MISERVGLPVSECLTRISYREYRTWMKHLEGEWDKPTLTHWYLMQLNSTVRNLFAKKSVQIKDSKLKFSSGKKIVTEEQKEQHQSWIKSLWLGRVGFKGKSDGK